MLRILCFATVFEAAYFREKVCLASQQIGKLGLCFSGIVHDGGTQACLTLRSASIKVLLLVVRAIRFFRLGAASTISSLFLHTLANRVKWSKCYLFLSKVFHRYLSFPCAYVHLPTLHCYCSQHHFRCCIRHSPDRPILMVPVSMSILRT